MKSRLTRKNGKLILSTGYDLSFRNILTVLILCGGIVLLSLLYFANSLNTAEYSVITLILIYSLSAITKPGRITFSEMDGKVVITNPAIPLVDKVIIAESALSELELTNQVRQATHRAGSLKLKETVLCLKVNNEIHQLAVIDKSKLDVVREAIAEFNSVLKSNDFVFG